MCRIVKMSFVLGLIILIGYLKGHHHVVAKAESYNRSLHLVYSSYQVNKNESFVVTISLQNISDLYNLQIYVPLDSNVKVDTPMYTYVNNSYFLESEFLQIDVKNQQLRVLAFRDNVRYNHSNTIIKLHFVALNKINDTKEVFSNAQIFLYDQQFKSIDYQISESEEMKVEWSVDQYYVDVNGVMPTFINDITVVNRAQSEYYIEIILDEINLTIIGNQILKICIYDYTNNTSMYLVKIVNVVDLLAPTIEIASSQLIINDNQLIYLASIVDEFVHVVDNYDNYIQATYQFYDEFGNLLNNVNEAILYFAHHQNGKIVYHAKDSSNNTAEEVTVKIIIKDTKPPVVEASSVINIEDTKISNFSITEYFVITDEFDLNPKVVLMYEGDYLEDLLTKKEILINYFGLDESGNQSDIMTIRLKLIDTTPPVLTGEGEVSINHSSIKTENWLQDYLTKTITVIEEYDGSYTLSFICYNHLGELITFSTLFDNLRKGYSGTLEYYVIDKSGNESNHITQQINIIDTTAPTIKIINIDNNKKYFIIDIIELDVIDNVEGDIDIDIYINGKLYDNLPIDLLGEYRLLVVATDQAGNEAQLEITFSIIKNNIIGCLGDAECYLRNYENIVYVAIILSVLVSVIVFLKVFLKIKKRHHQF